ncbi:putative NADH-ubiquinone oxidoreductase, 21kDa subunit [Plasmopara halstedii]
MEVKNNRPTLHDPHVPRFPVIYKNPTFQQVRDNVSQGDIIQSAVLSVAFFPLGYIVAQQLDRSLARSGMWFTGLVGSVCSVMLAYQNSSLRLQGFGRNDAEVARFQSIKKEDE